MNTAVLNGNELIVQGGLEAGFSLYTGYPGSPLADFFNILYKKRHSLQTQGIKVALANSEANAAAMASGAKQAGRHCLLAMKSMGLNVAADALSVGNFANPHDKTGVVVVVGDDPWSISTSAPMDSRFLYEHLHIPFLEPSTPQELKDWMKTALIISEQSSVYQGVLLTTFMAEGGGRVSISPPASVSSEILDMNPDEFDLSKNVMVPPNSFKADRSMIKNRFPLVQNIYKDLNLDRVYFDKKSTLGFISAGGPFEILRQVLDDYNLSHLSLYKVAGSYPLIEEMLLPWLEPLRTLVIVEEKRGFLEREIKKICLKNRLYPTIYGKKFGDEEGFPAYGGLSYEIVAKKLEQLSLLKKKPLSHKDLGTLPRRLPTFCPGCPHRETLSLLKELREVLKRKNINLVSHGDVGCYSLSFLPPFKEMHNLSAMGQGGALGAGMDAFTSNPSVVLMGDSTFFHSGMTDVSNSVQLNHQITYILLDNDNTAMTGHQMTPRTGESVEGQERPRQDMVEVVRSLGVSDVCKINPSDRYFYRNKLLDIILSPGVKVIVSEKECALTFYGRKKKEDNLRHDRGETTPVKNFYQINTDACEDCRECVEMTGCPGLTRVEDAYGSKVGIDPQICVADSYCTKLKACPSFSLVKVFDYHPKKYLNNKMKHEKLPLPSVRKSLQQIVQGGRWRAVVTGVGGSGVTTISKIISHAAVLMEGHDLEFKFVDQKGLAQRNGNVTSHLSIYPKNSSVSPVTPQESADVLLSPDLLDGSRHMKYLSQDGMAVFDDQFQVPLEIMLENEKSVLTSEKLAEMIKKDDRAVLFPMKKLAAKAIGKSVYTSSLCLGVAWQKGLLPFSLNAMENAFKKAIVSSEIDDNLAAFNLGRQLIVHKDLVLSKYILKNSPRPWKESVSKSLIPWHNKSILLDLFERDVLRLKKIFPRIKKDYLCHYIHDLFIYNRNSHRENFFSDAGKLSVLFKEEDQMRSLGILVRSYFIKDEVFISHIMTSPLQKTKQDHIYLNYGKKYKIHPINRPSFDIGSFKLEFDISPKTWMLKLMKHMRILRLILPGWHRKEKEINKKIRHRLLEVIPKLPHPGSALIALENIKGYRKIRYKKAENTL